MSRLACVVLAFAMVAAAKPSFQGEWKLNKDRSSFGEMPAPNSMSQKITHEDPKMKVSSKSSSDMGDWEIEANYTTDGKECTNDFNGNPFKSVLSWDGDMLKIDTKMSFNGADVTMQDQWTLSGDGKIMTIVRKFKSDMGEGEQKLVFDKQ